MKTAYRIGLMLTLLVFSAVVWEHSAMAYEEPSYSVRLQQKPFELREYKSYIVAETFVDGGFKSAGNAGFRRLFDYISGNNRTRDKIAMTTPVAQEKTSEKISMTAPVNQERIGNQWRVTFVVPSKYTLETVPQPMDERIIIRQVSGYHVAVLRYSGTWRQSRYEAKKRLLEEWVVEQGLTPIGDSILARYNSPFTPWFLRRNEVQIPVKSPKL